MRPAARRLLDDWPDIITVHNDQVMNACVREEVRSDALEGIFRFHKGGRRRVWLAGGCPIAVCTSFTELGNLCCYAGPEYRYVCPCSHRCDALMDRMQG